LSTSAYVSTSIFTKMGRICVKGAPLKGAPQPFGREIPQTAPLLDPPLYPRMWNVYCVKPIVAVSTSCFW